uniref:hypothetical protein n=1 Tax=Candidatus Electronema sp. TaxID=2698783 RepID=UPI0040575840
MTIQNATAAPAMQHLVQHGCRWAFSACGGFAVALCSGSSERKAADVIFTKVISRHCAASS